MFLPLKVSLVLSGSESETETITFLHAVEKILFLYR